MAGRGLYVRIKEFYTEYGYDLFYFGTGFEPEFNYTNAFIYRHSGDVLPDPNEFLMRVPEVKLSKKVKLLFLHFVCLVSRKF